MQTEQQLMISSGVGMGNFWAEDSVAFLSVCTALYPVWARLMKA